MEIIGKSCFWYTSEKDIADHILWNRADLLGEAALGEKDQLVNQIMRDYDWDKTPDYTGRKSRIYKVINKLLNNTPHGKESFYTSEEDICQYILARHLHVIAQEKHNENGLPKENISLQSNDETCFKQLNSQLKNIIERRYGWTEDSIFLSARRKRIQSAIEKARYFIKMQCCNEIKFKVESHEFKNEDFNKENYPVFSQEEFAVLKGIPVTLVSDKNPTIVRIGAIQKEHINTWDKQLKNAKEEKIEEERMRPKNQQDLFDAVLGYANRMNQ